MAEIHHSPSSSSSLQTPNQSTLVQLQYVNQETGDGISRVRSCRDEDEVEDEVKKRRDGDNRQLSLLAFFLTLFRKSFWVSSSFEEKHDLSGMEIGFPTDVRHVAHVTFDRFNGFLGLPVEFEPHVPRSSPSASTSVFGVSTQSMQVSLDSRGNSIPTILLLLQHRLYSQGGLQAEGIFRINAENSQEERLRCQLNSGVVPDGTDVHCLAGLIKAWFRELPTGILDHLSPKQLIRCQSEEECSALVRLLPPTEIALLDWAINLMADVVQQEHLNKMISSNIAMVFAPNIQKDYETQLYHKNQVITQMQSQIQRIEEELRDTKEELRCLQQVMTPPSLIWQDAQDPHSPQEDVPTQSLGMIIEDEVHQTIGATHEEPKVRKVLNRLYNVIVEFEVPGIPAFRANAILDTGATTCCISKSIVPEEALETLARVVYFNGVNSRQPAEHKIKQGSFVINGNKFPMPFIYALDMSITEGIQMLIGTNFTRSMNGGIRISCIVISGLMISITQSSPFFFQCFRGSSPMNPCCLSS